MSEGAGSCPKTEEELEQQSLGMDRVGGAMLSACKASLRYCPVQSIHTQEGEIKGITSPSLYQFSLSNEIPPELWFYLGAIW